MLGVTTKEMTFDEGRDYCKSNGGDLASIHSAFENLFIQTSRFLRDFSLKCKIRNSPGVLGS